MDNTKLLSTTNNIIKYNISVSITMECSVWLQCIGAVVVKHDGGLSFDDHVTSRHIALRCFFPNIVHRLYQVFLYFESSRCHSTGVKKFHFRP